MGKTTSTLSQIFCAKHIFYKVLILGPEGVGKTTIFHRIRNDEVNITFPTIGFNVEQIKIDNMFINLWDFGGNEKIMCLWEKYFDNVDLIILVLDSTDNQSLERIEEILKMIKTKSGETFLLILANKVDLKNQSMSTDEIAKLFKIYEMDLRIVNFIPCSATTGIGMKEMKKSMLSALSMVKKN